MNRLDRFFDISARGSTVGAEVRGGIVTFIAGLVTLAWPFDSIAALTLVVGIWLVVIGVFEIGSSLVMRRELTR